jgi:hypothetical protein
VTEKGAPRFELVPVNLVRRLSFARIREPGRFLDARSEALHGVKNGVVGQSDGAASNGASATFKKWAMSGSGYEGRDLA